jgi:trk system potassium uptake protein TrkA
MLTIGGHEVTVIESDGDTCEKLNSLYDISIIESEGIKQDVFNRENFEHCDLFIAVSFVDEMNILACNIARKVGAAKAIARIRNEDYCTMEEIINLRDMGIDEVIHPEKELSKELVNMVQHPNAIEVQQLYNGRILVVGTTVKESAGIAGKSLKEINSIFDLSQVRIAVVDEGFRSVIPRGDYIIEPGSNIYAVVDKKNVGQVFQLAGYDSEEGAGKDIMINGSGKIARTVAQALDKLGDFNIKMIVDDEDRAGQLSEILTRSLVVHGEGTDLNVLAAEGIVDMDFFLALSDNDETNVVASLVANHLEVGTTITLIEKTDYLPVTKTIGLQRCINSSIATSDAIMRHMRHSSVQAFSSLKGIDIKVISFKVSPKNKYINHPLKDIEFPKNTIIGVIVHEDQLFVPTGDGTMVPGDEVVVFAQKGAISRVEKMFAD